MESTQALPIAAATPPAMTENRRHDRIAQDLRVRLFDPKARVLDEHVLVADLSRSGLCLRSRSRLLDVGEDLHFQLELPSGKRLRGKAQVRWNRALGFANLHGLEIVRMGPIDRERLANHLFPRRLGWMRAADLAFQFALAAGILLCLREIMAVDPVFRQTVIDFLPYGLSAGGLGLLYLLTRL